MFGNMSPQLKFNRLDLFPHYIGYRISVETFMVILYNCHNMYAAIL